MFLVALALLRDQMKRPWQLLLGLTSIAIGVAVVVGVDIANQSAMVEFGRANSITDGAATHRIVGGSSGLDESVFRTIKVDLGIRNAAPVVSAKVLVKGLEGPYTLLGVDPFSEFRIRDLGINVGSEGDSARYWPLFVSANMFAQNPSAGVTLTVHDRSQDFNLVSRSTSGASVSVGADRILVSDISWVQEFLGMRGKIDHIAMKLPADADLHRIRQALPDAARLVDIALYNGARSDMTKAFRTNLMALSLLAMVIAMFLIYSSVSFQVVRRRKLFGLLRASGVTSLQLGTLLLLEVAAMGIAGTIIGIFLGVLLAEGLGSLVNQTINALYFSLAEASQELSVWTLSKAVFMGVLASLLAGLVPLLQCSRVTTRVLLTQTSVSGLEAVVKYGPWLSIAGLTVGAGLIALPTESLTLAFAGLFCVIISMALLAPKLLDLICRQVSRIPFAGRGLVAKMSILNVRAHLARTAISVAALAIAVSASLGVGLMIDSFRYSVDRWLASYLRADIYLTSQSATDEYLDPVFLEALAGLQGVRQLSSGTRRYLATEEGRIEVFSLDTTAEGFAGFQLKSSLEGDIWRSFQFHDQVIISEPLSRRMSLVPGDTIVIPTDRGNRELGVAAIYFDYSSDQGLVTMSSTTHAKLFDQNRIASAALYLSEEADTADIIGRIEGLSSAPDSLYVRSNRGLRQASLAVFDQTFVVTGVLRWLAMVVAVVGIISALVALQLERGREYAALKATGFSREQLSVQIMIETGFIGLAAGLLAIPIGVVLAVALIEVINIRSFGWSMQTIINWTLVAHAVALSIIAALVAGIYPAYRLWRTDIRSGLRNE